MPRPSAKGKLMEAALTSFQSRGFKGCTIEDIAEGAGVFKGSFYNHFKSKEALAVAAVEHYLAETVKTLALDGPPSPLKRLRAHFEALATMQTNAQNGCLLANFSAEISDATPDLRVAIDSGVNAWCANVAKVIRQAQAAGETSRRHKADALARFVVNAWEGAAIRMKVTRGRQPLEDFYGVVFKGTLAAGLS